MSIEPRILTAVRFEYQDSEMDIFCDFVPECQGESRFMFRLVSESINLLSLVPPPPTQQSAQPQMNEYKSVKHHQKILTMIIWYPYLTR